MNRETIRDELARAICAADDIWPPESRNGNSPNGLQWGLSIKRADAALDRLDSLGMVVVEKPPGDEIERERGATDEYIRSLRE